MHLLELPLEIRNHIYSHIFSPSSCQKVNDSQETRYVYDVALFSVNIQIRAEAYRIFHLLNTFVMFECPFQDVETFVPLDGKVPLVLATDERKAFWCWTLGGTVTAPNINHPDVTTRFVVHIDDLLAFCQQWYYSGQECPGLNECLAVDLALQDPRVVIKEEATVTENMQERLLLPLGMVKGLFQVQFTRGVPPLESVQEKLMGLWAE